MKMRLIVMNFLQFAVWGAYLTSMGTYLADVGLGGHIGIFYAIQGIVSLFMPAVLGIVADRWIPAQRLLGLSHLLAALFMGGAGYYAMTTGPQVEFAPLFSFYSVSVAFYMPTLALSNSVAYTALDKAGTGHHQGFSADTYVRHHRFHLFHVAGRFAGIPVELYAVLYLCGVGRGAGCICQTLPECPVSRAQGGRKSLVEALGLKAFLLFKNRKMAVFFIFSMLLGVSLQITNGFANPFITSFSAIPEYADTFGVQHANLLISLSQISEACCILLIPFFLGRFGIKRVMLIAMVAWVLRFGLFGLGDPGSGVWMFVLSMLVYGVAFDFFNVSGSLFVDKETDLSIRSSAQGLFIIMTNGIGATVGTLCAQAVVNCFVDFNSQAPQVEGWSYAWFVFAAYALVVAVVFSVVFKYKHNSNNN